MFISCDHHFLFLINVRFQSDDNFSSQRVIGHELVCHQFGGAINDHKNFGDRKNRATNLICKIDLVTLFPKVSLSLRVS